MQGFGSNGAQNGKMLDCVLEMMFSSDMEMMLGSEGFGMVAV